MRAEEHDDRLPSTLHDLPLDRMKRIIWIGLLESVAVEVELSFGETEDVRITAVQSHNITIAPILQVQLRVCFSQQLRES